MMKRYIVLRGETCVEKPLVSLFTFYSFMAAKYIIPKNINIMYNNY